MGYSLPLAHLLLRRHLLIILKMRFMVLCLVMLAVSQIDAAPQGFLGGLFGFPNVGSGNGWIRNRIRWTWWSFFDRSSCGFSPKRWIYLLYWNRNSLIQSFLRFQRQRTRPEPVLRKINSKYLVEFYYVMTIQIVFMFKK